jgi:hypothetical protein
VSDTDWGGFREQAPLFLWTGAMSDTDWGGFRERAPLFLWTGAVLNTDWGGFRERAPLFLWTGAVSDTDWGGFRERGALFVDMRQRTWYTEGMDEDQKSVYIESTIPSYATARPSADVVAAGRQCLTQFFWEHQRNQYKLYISQDVIDECKRGDPDAAQRRMDFIKGVDKLQKPEGLDDLAAVYQKLLNIPDRAKLDCSHLAYCVLEEIDYLLTWNCSHLGSNS